MSTERNPTTSVYKMSTPEQTTQLIGQATERAGGLRQLGKLIDLNPSTLVAMRKGERPANYRVRAKLRAVLGEHPASAVLAAVTEDLQQSTNATEKEAAAALIAISAMLDAKSNTLALERGSGQGLAHLEDAPMLLLFLMQTKILPEHRHTSAAFLCHIPPRSRLADTIHAPQLSPAKPVSTGFLHLCDDFRR